MRPGAHVDSTTKNRRRLVGGSAVLRVLRNHATTRAETARTRGFAAPAFAGCAFCYVVAANATIARGTDLVNIEGKLPYLQ